MGECTGGRRTGSREEGWPGTGAGKRAASWGREDATSGCRFWGRVSKGLWPYCRGWGHSDSEPCLVLPQVPGLSADSGSSSC